MERVTVFCFLASYGVALGLELWHQSRPRPVLRLLALGFGAAGLLTQTIFLAVQRPPLIWQFGWMLFLAWVLAIFYLYGSVHHRRQAWGVFVLPLVLGLVVLATAFGRPGPGEGVFSVKDAWGRQRAPAAGAPARLDRPARAGHPGPLAGLRRPGLPALRPARARPAGGGAD